MHCIIFFYFIRFKKENRKKLLISTELLSQQSFPNIFITQHILCFFKLLDKRKYPTN